MRTIPMTGWPDISRCCLCLEAGLSARLDLMDDATACVRTVAIKPEFQRRGFGRALMAGLDKIAAGHGVKRLVVHAARDAVSFYEALGWSVVDAGRDNPLLTKEL